MDSVKSVDKRPKPKLSSEYKLTYYVYNYVYNS